MDQKPAINFMRRSPHDRNQRKVTNVTVTDEVHDLMTLIAQGDQVAGEKSRPIGAAYREVIKAGLTAMGYELEEPL